MKKAGFRLGLAAVRAQFEGLDARNPGLWPIWPRVALLAALVLAVFALAWFSYWQGLSEDLEERRAKETQLRQQFVDKTKQAVNLAVLLEQKAHVTRYVQQLEKQLPSKAEMDALLSDINQAGVGRGLQFELFKPGQVVAREYYAELPISIRLTGGYHEFAAFTSDVANLPRIVTLHDLRITVANRAAGAGARSGGPLIMEATAKTFRYLDADEIAAQRQKSRASKADAAKHSAGGAK